MTPPALERVSHYKLLEPLGRGAMGEVWLAEDTQLPRKVAVKLLPRHLSEDGDAVARLLREAQAAASVDHPGVVTVYEAGVHDGRPYLVMQRVEGDTLEARLERGPLSVSETVKLGIEVADALAEARACSISASRASRARPGSPRPASPWARRWRWRPSRCAASRPTTAPISGRSG